MNVRIESQPRPRARGRRGRISTPAVAAAIAYVVTCIANVGVAAATNYSATCANSANVETFQAAATVGYYQEVSDRAYVGVSRPDDQTTWICLPSVGRIDVSTTTAGTPRIDDLASACAEEPGNQVPGPHPMQSGSVGSDDPGELPPPRTPWSVDAYVGDGEAWICERVGSDARRIVVPLAAPTPQVVHRPNTTSDLRWELVPVPATSPPGYPSRRCYDEAASSGDAGVAFAYEKRATLGASLLGPNPAFSAGIRTEVWEWYPSSRTRRCIRTTVSLSGSPAVVMGGVLDVPYEQSIPYETLRDDMAACPTEVARHDQSGTVIKRSRPDSPAPALCAQLPAADGSSDQVGVVAASYLVTDSKWTADPDSVVPSIEP
jgi:hypothetical protein